MSLTRQSTAMSTFTPSGAGATMRILSDALEDLCFNCKAYGAKGDGVTDDSAAIQAAVNAAIAAGGGMVLIPAGTYAIGSTINIRKSGAPFAVVPLGVTLVGAGRSATTLRRASAWTGPMVAFGTDGANIGIMRGVGVRDLTFACPTAYVEALNYTSCHLKFWDVQMASIRDVGFEEGPCDIYCRNLAQSEFSNIQSVRAYTPLNVTDKHAVVFEAGSNVCGDLFFRGCNFRTGHGFSNYVTHSTLLLRGCDGIFFDGCHLQGGKQTVLVDGTHSTGACGGLKISNSWLDLVNGIGTWGAWPNTAASYDYVKDQLTAYSGTFYRCHTPHTATESTGFDASKFTAVTGPNLEGAPFDSSHVVLQGNTANPIHNITIVNTTLMAGSSAYRRGITIENGARIEALRIEGCLFTGHGRESIAIRTTDASISKQIDIMNNRIQNIQQNNPLSGSAIKSAIYVGGASDVTITGNQINSTGITHGIMVNPGVNRCEVARNKLYIPHLYQTDPSNIAAYDPSSQLIVYDNNFWIA